MGLKLPRYIDKLTHEMKEAGNLEGILLTGLTKDGVELMETYVDRTGDVQTASFCMLKVGVGEVTWTSAPNKSGADSARLKAASLTRGPRGTS